MANLVSIIVPAFNQLQYCRQCVESILECGGNDAALLGRKVSAPRVPLARGAETLRLSDEPTPYRLILVDNGSTDGVGAYFDSVPGAIVLHAEKNLGFAGGVNLGLAHAQGHVLLLNSDTLVPHGWLPRLTNALESADDIGMVGPLSNCVSGSQQLDKLSFTTMDEIHAFANDLAQRNARRLRDVARLVGFCLLIREEAFKAVGLFDESYGIGNFEDDDYCLRMLRAGYRLCVAEDAFVFHYGSRTFDGMGITGDAWQTLIANNQRHFLSKWDIREGERSDTAQASRHHNRQANERLQASSFRLQEVLSTKREVRCSLKPEASSLKPDPIDITIREYQPQDESEWMRVHAIILSTSHAWNYTIQERPQYKDHQSTRLVAIAAGNIVALTDTQYENEPGEFCFLKDTPGGYVLEFGRLPEYAGHNLGKRLIDATIDDAKRKGFHRLEYWTMDRKAQRFYQRLRVPEIGRHYRFRMKPPTEIADNLLQQSIGIEYLYCACTIENWPNIRKQFDIIEKHPLEPHLCIGYEVRF